MDFVLRSNFDKMLFPFFHFCLIFPWSPPLDRLHLEAMAVSPEPDHLSGFDSAKGNICRISVNLVQTELNAE
jgi:hypothetical protein